MSLDSPTPTLDPHARYLNSSCLDLLLIELVPMAERIIRQLEAPDSSTESSSSPQNDAIPEKEKDKEKPSIVGMDDEEFREATYFRLEALGYRVGLGLVERFSRDRPLFADNLDVIKFICKDLWTILFRKQVDNLKTNHRGVYVLTDNTFRPFIRMSMAVRSEAISRAQTYLWFPCGILRGALAGVGIDATVQAESLDLPSATFQIKTTSSNAMSTTST
ncbi:Trafficking protein particle complex subunit 33 [Myotisia sp. PD_48]|nr:Trafficking protein particle complex subunit 33 [Myotisia sp. PD_48]